MNNYDFKNLNTNTQIMRYFIGFILLIGSSLGLMAQETAITVDELKNHIYVLASDSLTGRGPGTDGAAKAEKYILSAFADYKLELLGENGRQYFDLITGAKAGEKNSVIIGDHKAQLGEDFLVYNWSSSSSLKADLVFVGYGFDIQEDSLIWDDYQGMDVKGKWVIILRGDPEPDKKDSPFILFADDRDKVLKARDNGAAGVVFTDPSYDNKEDKLPKMYFDKSATNIGIPVLYIKRSLMSEVLKQPVDSLDTKIRGRMMPASFATGIMLDATTDIQLTSVKTCNLVAMLKGSDPILKDEYIVIGAHYDHLGMGGPGSGSRDPETMAVHNGADDNASGVAGIIEIAGKLAGIQKHLKRSVVIIAFGAEESGILGSRYFVDHPLVPIKSIKAMINFDMIGRLNEETKSISIGGTGTSVQGESYLQNILTESGLKAAFSPEGYGPSDHASFYGADIPVIYFNTGVHTDYHTPADDADKINYEGEKEVCELAFNLIVGLANQPENLIFTEAGPKKRTRMGRGLKVTFGIMPDFTSTDGKGLGVGGVTKEGPADKAGMKKGDKIIGIEGKPVGDIYEYMNRLKSLEPHTRVSVDIQRGDEKIVLIVEL